MERCLCGELVKPIKELDLSVDPDDPPSYNLLCSKCGFMFGTQPETEVVVPLLEPQDRFGGDLEGGIVYQDRNGFGTPSRCYWELMEVFRFARNPCNRLKDLVAGDRNERKVTTLPYRLRVSDAAA